MKNIIIIFLIFLTSCSSEKENLIIEGKITGIKNSNIYLSLVEQQEIIDSAKVINGKFNLQTFINEPLEMSLILDDKNSENKFNFITEPTDILFTSSKDKFEYNGKIINSKLYTNFKNLENQINRFDEKDLEMLAEQIEVSIMGNQKKYDSINKQRIKVNQKKILFIVNYAINNNSNPLSAFITYKYKANISKNYLEKIYESLIDEVKDSYYGNKISTSL